MMSQDDKLRTDKLKRARDYPYESPRFSFTYHHQYKDGLLPFDSKDTVGRHAVLAFGSNKAPAQLARKFGSHPESRIPVEMITLHDFDVVFAAHISSYGALPAMLQHCPGTSVEVAITWLTDQELEIMHATELHAANYKYARLDQLRIDREAGERLDSLHAYIGQRGHFNPFHKDANAIAITDIVAHNRHWQQRSCAEMLQQLHGISNFCGSEEDFIHQLIDDAAYRQSFSQSLSRPDTLFSYPFTPIK